MAERTIVVGVTAHQPDRVVREAARFARAFDASLVCAHVDPVAYVVDEYPDGSIDSRPIDPDAVEWNGPAFAADLAGRIETMALEETVTVEFRELAGDIGHALGRLADVLKAEMIIVGSRRGGLRVSMHEIFGGSVAAHQAHRQTRPVVVIPLSPVPAGGGLPWEGAAR